METWWRSRSMTSRDSWQKYFLNLAKTVSSRATCTRLKVGCVVVKNKTVVATGYNGSPSGSPHCTDVGCLIENSSCQRTIHAELNAITQAAKHGNSVDGAAIYVTHEPCFNCLKHILTCGIKDIYFSEDYGTRPIEMKLEIIGITNYNLEITEEYKRVTILEKQNDS
jgi:dCMP deaminase